MPKLESKFPNAEILDLTSRGPEPWVRFSPFFPHEGIPVPNSSCESASVEGVWQGLKVFEKTDIDTAKFQVRTMKKLKRTVRKFGRCLGHRFGTDSNQLLGYRDARYRIYLPTYLWVLEHKLEEEVAKLRSLAENSPLVLLDYETNDDVNNLSKPLSHAGLLRLYLLREWPVLEQRASPCIDTATTLHSEQDVEQALS